MPNIDVKKNTELLSEATKEIEVTIYCVAYNHEKYIRDTIEGFLSQRTTFRYEVIVHDDASTDRTAEIIREYASRYPEIIKPILQEENQYSKFPGGMEIERRFMWPQTRGKYIAMCEGDDFWTDPNKLQLQYEAMELHPECSICTHYTKVLKQGKSTLGNSLPNGKYRVREGVLDPKVQMDISLNDWFHWSSFFLRTSVFSDCMTNEIQFVQKMKTGDTALMLYFAKFGFMYFINREMSAYRHGTEGSWTVRIARVPEAAVDNVRNRKEALVEYLKFYDGEYNNMIWQSILDCDTRIAILSENYMKAKKHLKSVNHVGGLKLVLKVLICSMKQQRISTLSTEEKK